MMIHHKLMIHTFCSSSIGSLYKRHNPPQLRPSVEQCKCPICSQPVSKLIPEASALSKKDEEVVEICKNIQQYNCLYAGGIRGLFVIFRGLPLYLQRITDQLLDIDRYFINFQRLRFIINFRDLVEGLPGEDMNGEPCRLFKDGSAVKGTLLVNKKPKTKKGLSVKEFNCSFDVWRGSRRVLSGSTNGCSGGD